MHMSLPCASVPFTNMGTYTHNVRAGVRVWHVHARHAGIVMQCSEARIGLHIECKRSQIASHTYTYGGACKRTQLHPECMWVVSKDDGPARTLAPARSHGVTPTRRHAYTEHAPNRDAHSTRTRGSQVHPGPEPASSPPGRDWRSLRARNATQPLDSADSSSIARLPAGMQGVK